MNECWLANYNYHIEVRMANPDTKMLLQLVAKLEAKNGSSQSLPKPENVEEAPKFRTPSGEIDLNALRDWVRSKN